MNNQILTKRIHMAHPSVFQFILSITLCTASFGSSIPSFPLLSAHFYHIHGNSYSPLSGYLVIIYKYFRHVFKECS